MSDSNTEEQVRRILSQQTSLDRFFNKLTEQARQVIVFADEEAALFNHNYIGTEHLLMGLLREGKGIAATVLRDLGIELTAVHAFVEQVVGRGTPQPEEAQRPLVPRVQAVLMLAVSEAWRSQYMDTEHLLIGLVREGEGIAAGALETLGAPLEQVRLRTYQAILSRGLPTESLKTVIKNKSNVITCRIDDQDLDALDALVEVGIRSTRSDAASWLIHAGIEANRAILESVYATVAEIRQLRVKAQVILQQAVRGESKLDTPG